MNKQSVPISIPTLLFRYSPKLLVFAVLLGAVAGSLYSLVIPFVLKALTLQTQGTPIVSAKGTVADTVNSHYVIFFFVMCCLILFSKAISVILVNNIAKSATAQLRISIAEKINRVLIEKVENLGFPKLLNILVDDVNNVASAAISIPMLLVSGVTVIGMLGYLATLNIVVFVVVLVAIIFGLLLFQIPASFASKLYHRARSIRDVFQEGIRGLVFGAFELKLDQHKSRTYLKEEIIAPQHESVGLEKLGDAIIHLAGTASDLLSFFIIGLVVFVVPHFIHFPPSESYGVIMALLYIAGPVASILGMVQHIQMGQVALSRIHQLSNLDDEMYSSQPIPELDQWKIFTAKEVTYRYAGDNVDNTFHLKPVSLKFHRGQIHFIVGGNGSGKSTLSKLLSLHHIPTSGVISFDDMVINETNISQARSKIGVIYSNYYLFGKIYAENAHPDLDKINHYLKTLGLQGKTEFVEGRFTTTKLSDGQRRRLALLVALLEDKDIYIFDEWAADQDPEFKKVFYTEILPEIKSHNKLVIAITHDDRYFHCADELIFMEEGGLKEIRRLTASTPL